MRRKVTIQEIARESGASMTTVSMVLRDKPGIGEETRQRVLTVARELGYQRRTPAIDRQMVRTVAMILRSRTKPSHTNVPSVNPFYSDVIAGIEAAARLERFNLIYATMAVDQHNRPYELPVHLLTQELDGILLIGAFSSETVSEIADGRSGPTVLVDAPARSNGHDAVVSDNRGGATVAVRYLIERGHRRIAMAGPDLDADPNFGQRRQGYLDALAEHDLTPVLITTSLTGMTPIGDAVADTLASHPDITAIFGANDASAIEAMRGAQQTGRVVPADVSVIGFDDIARASEVSPSLTTMAVDRVSMGRQAIRMLQYRLAWPDAGRLMTVLQPEVVARGSVGPARADLPSETPASPQPVDTG